MPSEAPCGETSLNNLIDTVMSTSDKRATDPLDRLIHEKGLRAKHVIIDKKLDLLLVILNTGGLLRVRVSDYPTLKKASKVKLNDWRLISNGIGIHWNQLDEDLSIKGMLRQSSLDNALRDANGRDLYKAVA